MFPEIKENRPRASATVGFFLSLDLAEILSTSTVEQCAIHNMIVPRKE